MNWFFPLLLVAAQTTAAPAPTPREIDPKVAEQVPIIAGKLEQWRGTWAAADGKLAGHGIAAPQQHGREKEKICGSMHLGSGAEGLVEGAVHRSRLCRTRAASLTARKDSARVRVPHVFQNTAKMSFALSPARVYLLVCPVRSARTHTVSLS